MLWTCLSLAALQFSGCSSPEQRADDYYKQGMSYLAKKEYVKAKLEIKNALQLKGDMIEAWRALAQIDEHEQNWKELAGSLRKIIELNPKDIGSMLRLSKLFLVGGAPEHALKLASQAAENNPQNSEAMALQAAALFKINDNDGAMRVAKKALEIEPGNPDANIVVAVIKNSEGDANGALQTLENVASAHKNSLGVLQLKFQILDHEGNQQQAEVTLRKLIALHPKENFFRTQLIRFFLAHKRQDDALHELRAVVAADPADTAAELQLTALLNGLKGPTAARNELVRRINAGGDVFPYQIALAKLDFVHGNLADSTAQLKHLISSSTSPDHVLTARITLAEMYLNKKNVAAAQPLIADILRADTHNTDGLRLRALIRINQDRYDDAIADLRTALNYQPQSPQLLATLALAYERSGSIELADKAYFDATKASGFAPNYGLNYVAFLRRRGLAAQAGNVLNDLASRNHNNVAVLSALAQDKLAHHDWDGAHAVAEEIRKLGDKADLADQISGVAFSGQNKLSESVAAFHNVYEANPGATQPMAELVRLYLQSNQIGKAEALVQAALKANPRNAKAIVLMGSIQLAKHNLSEAEQNFKNAIKQQPKDVVGYKALTDFYVGQRKYDAALDITRSGLKLQPNSFALQLTLAGLLEAKGDYEAAITEYEAMLKDEPGSMVVANNLASLLSDHRADKPSLEHAAKLTVLLKKSQVPQFKDTIGWVDYRRGDYAAAAPMLEDAAAALPNNALVRYHLGMSYLSTGQDTKAMDQFKRAKDLAPNDADLKKKIDAALKGRPEDKKG
jgi:tetratricopeptide (TPR) repeat protein